MAPFSLTRAFSRKDKKVKATDLHPIAEEHGSTIESFEHTGSGAGWKGRLKRKKPPPVPASNAGGTGHLMVVNGDEYHEQHYVHDQNGHVIAQDHYYPDGIPRNHTGSLRSHNTARHHDGAHVEMYVNDPNSNYSPYDIPPGGYGEAAGPPLDFGPNNMGYTPSAPSFAPPFISPSPMPPSVPASVHSSMYQSQGQGRRARHKRRASSDTSSSHSSDASRLTSSSSSESDHDYRSRRTDGDQQSYLSRHHTGQSHHGGGHYHTAPTIIPADSVSNIGYNPPHHPGQAPLTGIVEEHSDVEYVHAHHPHLMPETPGYAGRGSMMFTQGEGPMAMPIPQVHTGGTAVRTHHTGGTHRTHHTHGTGNHHPHLAPLDVRDGNGVRQEVKEILLDGSGMQTMEMPADGNVVFIIEEGVTLEVQDPVTKEFVPLEEYYANLAARQPTVHKTQDQFIVVNGDASNLIVEDTHGNVLHRGSSSRSRSSSDSEHLHRHHSGNHHVRHHDGTVVHHP